MVNVKTLERWEFKKVGNVFDDDWQFKQDNITIVWNTLKQFGVIIVDGEFSQFIFNFEQLDEIMEHEFPDIY